MNVVRLSLYFNLLRNIPQMGSFDNATLLCKRALSYLRTAKDSFDKGIYDVSAANCQISAELPIKSTYLLLGVNFPQTYSIRKLLYGLAMVASNYSEEIQRFIKEKRKELNLNIVLTSCVYTVLRIVFIGDPPNCDCSRGWEW